MVDTHCLPIIQPTIRSQLEQVKYFPDDIDLNRTVYSIAVEHGANTVMQYVNFEPEDTTLSIPRGFKSSGSIDYSTGYYSLYSYDHFVTMCNNTIKSILSDAAFVYPTTLLMPTLLLDWSKVSFQVPSSDWDSSVDTHYKIYFNTATYRLFNSLPVKHLNTTCALGRSLQLDTANFSNNDIILSNYNTIGDKASPQTELPFLIISQEYSTTANWSPVSSIAFTSDSLNVVNSHVSSLHEYIHNQEITVSSSSNTIAMITDLAACEYLLGILYNPSGEYRWIDLTSSGPIKKIQLKVFWVSNLQK